VLLTDPDKVASAKYNFVVAIAACIDIASQVIAAEGFRAPRDNADSFAIPWRGPCCRRPSAGVSV